MTPAPPQGDRETDRDAWGPPPSKRKRCAVCGAHLPYGLAPDAGICRWCGYDSAAGRMRAETSNEPRFCG